MLRQFTSFGVRVSAQSRGLCTKSPNSLHGRVSTKFDDLMVADWVDTDDTCAALTDEAEALVQEYRSVFTGEKDDLYVDVEALHIAKEAAQATEAYSRYAMYLMREHEDMIGALGNNTEIPEGGADEALQTIQEYVELVNVIEDKRIRRKVEEELGRKISFLKMVVSVPGFSAKVAPVAGDKIVTRTMK